MWTRIFMFMSMSKMSIKTVILSVPVSFQNNLIWHYFQRHVSHNVDMSVLIL